MEPDRRLRGHSARCHGLQLRRGEAITICRQTSSRLIPGLPADTKGRMSLTRRLNSNFVFTSNLVSNGLAIRRLLLQALDLEAGRDSGFGSFSTSWQYARPCARVPAGIAARASSRSWRAPVQVVLDALFVLSHEVQAVLGRLEIDSCHRRRFRDSRAPRRTW